MDEVVALLSGPAMGGALVGLVWAIARYIRDRGAASAVKDRAEAAAEVAAAKAVTELVIQIGTMRSELAEEKSARLKLEVDFTKMRSDFESEKSSRMHYESQVGILTQEVELYRGQADQERRNSMALKNEMEELRKALEGGYHQITLPPPRI